MKTSIARLLSDRIADQLGYSQPLVDELAPFVEVSDIVLNKGDGMYFSAVCVVDAEDDDTKSFEIQRAEARALLATCRDRYCGTLGGAKQPARLDVVEIRKSLRARPM